LSRVGGAIVLFIRSPERGTAWKIKGGYKSDTGSS
jgi:hypothetical protein